MSKTIQIAVVGSGYVGLVAAVCFADIGHDVLCVDNDERKVAALGSGDALIHEKYLPELLGRHRNNRIRFTTDLCEATRDCQAIFIAVGTPQSETGDADLSYVEAVACEIARSLTSYKVIVEKSTVPVYTNEWIRRAIERNGVARRLFDVVSNPEFLREGTAVQDFLHPDRIVVGADSERRRDAAGRHLRAADKWSILRAAGRNSRRLLDRPSSAAAQHLDQVGGDHQARLQRISGAEDLLHQRSVQSVRGDRRQH